MATPLQHRPAANDDTHSGHAQDQAHYDREFGDIQSHYGETKEHPLGEQETRAAQTQSAETAGASAPASRKAVAEAEDSAKKGLYRSGEDDEGGDKFKKTKAKFWTRRKAAVGMTGAGGVTAVIVAFFMFSGPFKIPAIVGNFENDIGSSRMTRRIVEKRFERMLIKYMIAKKAGNLDRVARPGSALDKMYKMFDRIDIEGMIKRQNGIEFVVRGGRVHILHRGQDLGPVSSDPSQAFQDYEQKKKEHKAFRRAAVRIYTQTFPIMRFGLSTTLRRYIYQWVPRFGTPPYNEGESKEENLKRLNQHQVDTTMEGPVRTLGKVTGCLLDDKDCEGLERSNQPVDTTDPAIRRTVDVGGDTSDNRSLNAVSETAEESFTEARAEVGPTGSFTDKWLEKIFTKIVGAITAKSLVAAIPAVGQIDLLAQIQHAIGDVFSKHLAQRTAILLKEHSYAAIAGMWLGFADEVKEGSMALSFADSLSERLTGHSEAATHKMLYGGDPSKGVPVDPKVGSNLDDPMGDALDFIYGRLGIFIRFPLEIWYEVISKPLAALAGFAGDLLGFLLIPIKGMFESAMARAFGPNWKEELAKFAGEAIMKLFGLTIDALASGAKLANYIYVGLDIIFNRYLQTNLGARDITKDPTAAGAYLDADTHYREGIAALPLTERLFSTDLSGSLVNKLVIAAPGSIEPSTVASSIIGPIKMLPSTIMSLISGRSLAAPTVQQMADIDGVAQFGGNDGEINADIASEVTTQEVAAPQDVSCPPNADGFFNNCQSYKETIQIGMCIDVKNPCPQFKN